MTDPSARRGVTGTIFGIDQTAIHDGPGVRMNVYLKGCPLRCVWCHSPESQSAEPEVVWYETKCAHCGGCVEVCPEGLRSFDVVDDDVRGRCRLCGACVSVCPAGALEVKGRQVTAGDIADEAIRLKPFFRRTGGGITLTGGEPTAQPEFAFAIASLSREAGIHVAIETCGSVEWRMLSRLAEVVDLFLFDVKHAMPGPHKEHTGVSNRRILGNLQQLVQAGAGVIARVPLIPSVNDDPETIRAIGRRVTEIGVQRIALLPFNPATHGKYSWLRREPPLPDATRQTPERIETLEQVVSDEGLQVVSP
ncbi:MAG: glycyl-radical enzyme activating protein [Armatimonadota bacterium]